MRISGHFHQRKVAVKYDRVSIIFLTFHDHQLGGLSSFFLPHCPLRRKEEIYLWDITQQLCVPNITKEKKKKMTKIDIVKFQHVRISDIIT